MCDKKIWQFYNRKCIPYVVQEGHKSLNIKNISIFVVRDSLPHKSTWSFLYRKKFIKLQISEKFLKVFHELNSRLKFKHEKCALNLPQLVPMKNPFQFALTQSQQFHLFMKISSHQFNSMNIFFSHPSVMELGVLVRFQLLVIMTFVVLA